MRCMMPARILGTGSALPDRKVSNEEVADMVELPISSGDIYKMCGIESRYWVERGSRSAQLGAKALRRALQVAGIEATDLRRLIFVNSSGGDWAGPATANDVAAELELSGQCDCFDINNACTGFLTALDVGARSLMTGLGPIGIVVSEILSDIIDPADPRVFLIMGDAAGAVVLGEGHPDEGILGLDLRNDPSFGQTAYIEHSRWSGNQQPLRFNITNTDMIDGAIELLVETSHKALEEAGLSMSEVEWVLPHQPNGRAFERFIDAFGVDRERTVKVVHEIGSVTSASIPYSLDRLFHSGQLYEGDRILMSAIGGGVCYGALVFKVGVIPPASRR